MIIGEVVGNIVSTCKEAGYKGYKLLLVQPYDPLEKKLGGTAVLAIDTVDAGVGDLVIVIYEGGSARMVLSNPDVSAECIIAGVIDRIDV